MAKVLAAVARVKARATTTELLAASVVAEHNIMTNIVTCNTIHTYACIYMLLHTHMKKNVHVSPCICRYMCAYIPISCVRDVI